MELIYKDLISDELEELEISLLESISSDVNLATEISNYLLVSGGKRIRPSICILLAKVFNYEGNDLIKLAASIELLHTATLIHDDVVDESLIRRGKESIHSKWDNAHGVLVGDFVYSKAFQLMASFEDQKIIRELANSTNRISEGEVLQLSFKQEVLEEKDYLEIVDRKTGEISYGKIPPYSVVVPGSLPDKNNSSAPSLYCAVIIKQVDEKTRSKTSINDLLRD